MDNQKTVNINVSTATIFKTVLFFVALWFLFLVWDLIIILFAALILAALIDPLADWFEKKRISRGVAVILIYVGLLVFLVLVVLAVVPIVIEEAKQLLETFPVYWEKLLARFGQPYSEIDTFSQLQQSLRTLESGLSKALGGVVTTVAGFFGGLASLIVILVITFYVVVEKESLNRAFYAVLPERYHPRLSLLLRRAQQKIGGWLRGMLVLGLVVGVMAYLGLSILGVNYALVLGLVAAVGEFIPYIGPVLAGIPAVFLAFAQSPLKALFVIILYVIIQQVENSLLVPKVMKRTVGLNPIISIIAVVIGFKIAGIVGAILAIPAAGGISVFVKDFLEIKERKS